MQCLASQARVRPTLLQVPQKTNGHPTASSPHPPKGLEAGWAQLDDVSGMAPLPAGDDLWSWLGPSVCPLPELSSQF